MSVEVETQIVIQRPRAAVAAIMFDPRHDADWSSDVVSSRILTAGPIAAGTRVARVSRFLGRELAYDVEIVAMDGDTSVEMRSAKPFPLQIRFALEDTEGGTRARIHVQGDPRGYFRLAGPVIGPVLRRTLTGDLRTLKGLLEAHDAPATARPHAAPLGV